MGSVGLINGGAGTPVVGSESGEVSNGGGRVARMFIKVLLREPGLALVAPIVLFLPFRDAVATSMAFGPVNPPLWAPPALTLGRFLPVKLTPFWAAATDAVASSSSAGRLKVSPRRRPTACRGLDQEMHS